jgi:hypothetical protein
MNLKKNFSLISPVIEEFYSSTREHYQVPKDLTPDKGCVLFGSYELSRQNFY